MALDTTTVVASSTVNGLKSLSLSSVPALETTVNVSGALLAATGIFLIGAPIVIFGTRYIIKKVKKNKDGTTQVTASSMNGKVMMSIAVASMLLISVGTAMMPRTETVMIVHIIAGYTCLVLSVIHIYQYRKVIEVQSKKFFEFLNAPKKPLPAVSQSSAVSVALKAAAPAPPAASLTPVTVHPPVPSAGFAA